MTKGSAPKLLPGDNPIRDSDNDVLERAAAAAAFAWHVLDLDASEGTVVGVFGPWSRASTGTSSARFNEAGATKPRNWCPRQSADTPAKKLQ